jgi:hypothetical protein
LSGVNIIMTMNESSASRILFSLTPVNNEWFRKQRRGEKLNDIRRQLATESYSQYWDSFCEHAGIMNTHHKPTNFAIIVILSLDDDIRDQLDENLEDLELTDEFSFAGAVLESQGTRCACGKQIFNLVGMLNKRNNIRFHVGIDCCEKNKLLPKDVIVEVKKHINDAIKKRDNKECESCGKLCIPKKDEAASCKKCTKKKEKLEEAQRAQEQRAKEEAQRAHERAQRSQEQFQRAREQVEEDQKIQNSTRVGRWEIRFGKKHKGEKYVDVVEEDPGYLVYLYNKGWWDDDEYRTNTQIKEFIEFNLADLI